MKCINFVTKTVELIIETTPWIPKPKQVRPDAIVGVKVELEDVKLQKQLRQVDGKWNRQLRLWEIRYDQAVALDLQARIEPSTLPDSRKSDMANSRQGSLPTIM